MNTKDILKSYISQEILNDPGVKINDEELLVGGDLISSLGVVRLVAFIEEHFNVIIPFEDVTIENFRTLSALADYIGTLPSKTAHT